MTKTVPAADSKTVNRFINLVKEASQSKVSVDWRNVLAIEAVLCKQNFKSVSDRDIKNLTEKFIETYTVHSSYTGADGKRHSSSSTEYRLRSLDTVMGMLNLTSDEKRDVQNYLNGINLLIEQSGPGMLDGATVEGVRYGIPRFYQTDSRWANVSYGDSTIGIGGCGTTSFAMVATGMNPKNLSALDTNGDKIIDPIESSNYSASHGYKTSEGTAWGFFNDAGSKIGLTVAQYTPSQYTQVLSDLKNGYPVISSQGPGIFTRGGHLIVLAGITDDGKIIVNDPASESRSSKTWSKEDILASALQFWSFKKQLGSGQPYVITSYTGDPSENGGVAGRYSANGTDLWQYNLKNRLIAVDPSKIKLGQKVYLQFSSSTRYVKLPDGTLFNLDGVYTAVDTGGDIKNNRIDLYVGYDSSGQAWLDLAYTIGRQSVTVYTDY